MSFGADGSRTWGEQFDFLQGTWAAECPFRKLKVAFCSAVSDQVGKDKELKYFEQRRVQRRTSMEVKGSQ